MTKTIGTMKVKFKKTIFSLKVIFLILIFLTKKKDIMKKGMRIPSCLAINDTGKIM